MNPPPLDQAPAAGRGEAAVLEAADFQALLEAIQRRGYRTVGPTLRHGHFVYDEIITVSDLPRGLTDEQEAGTFRLKERDDPALFGYGVGQQSWKQFLFPPRQLLWQASRQGTGFSIVPTAEEVLRYAFIGVHACDLHALAVLDRVFLKGPYVDAAYQRRRTGAFILTASCTQVCGTGFCASLGTGPQAKAGFDLALTEVLKGGRHFFLVEVGTSRGAEILAEVPHKTAALAETAAALDLVAQAAMSMGRSIDPTGLKDLLYRSYEHPRWDDVATRCLTCGNCTLVCPTCFCHTTEDLADLTGTQAERRRRLDSCFNVEFSYLHGGSVRTYAASRYRQWLTHKLATWQDQFGFLGCVGCGRCLTWCPVAIDITAEVRAIRESDPLRQEEHHGKP